jgi:SAM-dependent methyltransferase
LERAAYVVQAFEPFGEAVDIARDRHTTIEVRAGELPRRLPYPESSFDLVAALDVLEHVDDDVGVMASLVQLARPGGLIIVTVPAHQILWASHDRRLHHLRRYGRRQIRELAEGQARRSRSRPRSTPSWPRSRWSTGSSNVSPAATSVTRSGCPPPS